MAIPGWAGKEDSPTKGILESKLFEESHRISDTDQGDDSIHHTLGYGPFQSARGSALERAEQQINDLDAATAALGVFTDFVPTLSGWTYSSGQFRYTRIGDLVTVEFGAVIASVSGTMQIALPFPANQYFAGSGEVGVGTVRRLFPARYGATIDYTGGTTVIFCDEVGNIWGVGNPAAWVAGNFIGGSFTYEAV